MVTASTIWPTPEGLFAWFGEENIARDPQEPTTVTAVNANAVFQGYSQWYSTHEDASNRIDELQADLKNTLVERATMAGLKTRIKQLEKELRAVRIADDTRDLEELQTKLAKSQEKTKEWKERYDRLFDLTDSLQAIAGTSSAGVHSTFVHKIKPHEPTRFDGSQNPEVVMQFLNDVEHYVRQGGSVCPKATADNQHIDTMWRFLSTKIFGWFQNEMKRRGVHTIPPQDHDYRITWSAIRTAFKKQFIPEVAISAVRSEWHALKFNKVHVLKFNRRALELIEFLGGSLTITCENPLWDEYKRKLPEATANDIAQQTRLMYRLNNVSLTLSDMMDIVADRTLPYMATTPSGLIEATLHTPDPMDLSNIGAEVNTIDKTTQCHCCGGIGDIAHQCGTPCNPNRPAQFWSGTENQRQDNWGHNPTNSASYEKSTYKRQDTNRKFRLGKQLVKVLVGKYGYQDAFHEHILDGRIAEALEVGLEHFREDSSVASKELLLPLHFTEFERLLETLGQIPGEDKQSRPYDSLSGLPLKISSALSEWASIRDQLRSSSISDVFSALPEGFHKDVLAILMVVNWRDLKLLDGCESVALTELRGVVQALIRVVNIWGSGRDPNKELPLSTAIVMGAFSLPDTQEMWHLQYSPIREGQPGQSLIESKSLSVTIQKKLLVRMLELLLELEQTARTIWDPVAGDLCSDHISQGNCTNIRCPNRHVPPSKAEYRSRIEGLEMMSTLVCSFNIVHEDLRYNKFGDEEILRHFTERFHRQKRRWLEYFLKEAVFRSAIQHDCDASTDMMSNIASGRKEYAAIFNGLESLLFHRLASTSGESHLRKDLSSIFEQLQLSESLAPRVAGRFRRYAKPIFHRPTAFRPLSLKEEYENQLFEAYHGLNTVMNDARTNAAVGFKFNLKHCLGSLSKLPLNDFTCFHSIGGIFERLAAFLMLWTCQSACVFPVSWIKIHLPVLICQPDQITRKQPERDIYGDCLITLLDGFMTLLERLNATPPPFNQPPQEPFRFTYGAKKIGGVVQKLRTFGQGIQERNRNLLAIAIIHLTSMNAPLRGMVDIYERAQKLFLSHYLLGAKFHRRPTLGMLESLHASFAQYGGKDSLAIVNIKDKPLPAVFSPLSTRGVPTYTLASLAESMKPHRMPSGDTAEESDGTSQDVVVRAAVRKLQAFWRRRGPYLPKYRLSLELPRGKESAFIFDNIIKPSLKAIREQQRLQILKISHRKEPDEFSDRGEGAEATKQDKPPTVPRFIPGILAKTMVLDTVGVDFFVTLGNLRKDATEADKLFQRVLTDSKMLPSAVEELIESNDMAELNKIVKTVSREMLAVKEVAEIYADPKRDGEELRRRLVREKDKAEIMRWKLMDIVETLERM